MELFILIIATIIIVVMITSFRQEVKKNMRILNKNIINVRKELDTLKPSGTTEKPVEKQGSTFKASPLKPLEVSGQRLNQQPLPKKDTEKPVVVPPKKVEEKRPTVALQKPAAMNQPKAEIKNVKAINKPTEAAQKPAVVKPKKDYEKLIGENWLNKIGIAILVIGIGFFVKYAIDKNWIGEVGRVGIGLLTGGILVGIAHFMRKKYRAFSSVLIGGGISVFYYTIAIAYHDYHIFGQKTAFGIMVGITLFSTLAAVIYDRKELAIIALIGGFTTPFMVSNGSGNYITFFTYIAILNSGMLILSYFKKWDIISKLALGFTVLFFGAWALTTNLSGSEAGEWAVRFSTIFFVQFLGMSLIYNLVRKINFNAWEFIQLTGISALYYGTMMFVLKNNDFALSMGGFTIIMSAFYIALGLFTALRKGTDPALVYLLIGKALTFVTITGALLFDGKYMTLFWSIEAVVILALGQFTKLRILKNASVLLTVVALIGLIKDWMITYTWDSIPLVPFANGMFFTGLFVVATLGATFIMIRKEEDEKSFTVGNSQYHFMIGALVFLFSYLTILLEMIYQLDNLHFWHGEKLVLWIFHLLLVLIGFIIARARKSALMTQIFFFIGGIGTVAYLIAGQVDNFRILTEAIRFPEKSAYYFLHFVAVGVVIALLIFLKRNIRIITEDKKHINWFLAALSIVGLIMATVELDQLIAYAYKDSYPLQTILRHTRTEGYTILWGLYSFLLMILGMQKKNQVMRILALIMFSITLIKLFIFDIQNISEAGKIVAFISLGVFLLVVSFMYQKLKAIIVGD